MLHVFTDMGNVAIWGSTVLLVFFLAQYSRMDPWWSNPVGRLIVALAVIPVVIFIPSLIALADPAFTGFGTSLWYRWVAIWTVIFTFVTALAIVVTWERARRARSRIERENGQQRESERTPS